MSSGVIDPARQSRIRRIVGGSMEGEVIRSVAHRPVGNRLNIERSILPMPPAREAFHVHDFFAVDVRRACRFFDDPDVVLFPEFATWNIQCTKGFQRVDGNLMEGWPRSARFGAEQQAVFIGYFSGRFIEGVDQQIA